jgi:hypothetical protein
MWCWRRTEKIKWPEKVTNEQVHDCIGERQCCAEETIVLDISSEKIATIMMPMLDR